VGGSPAHIEEDAATRLIHQAIDAGVNYFDTAWPYAVGLARPQSYSGSQPGPWDSAAISASNLSHKKQACDLSGSSGATSIWTEGGTCSPAGSLGHCTDAATNAWDPATQVLSSSLVGVWSVP
jgi:hypothetical protein